MLARANEVRSRMPIPDPALTSGVRQACNSHSVLRTVWGSEPVTTGEQLGRKGENREGTVSPRRGRRGCGMAGACAVRSDGPRGVLPREGRLDEGGQEGLPHLRGAG